MTPQVTKQKVRKTRRRQSSDGSPGQGGCSMCQATGGRVSGRRWGSGRRESPQRRRRGGGAPESGAHLVPRSGARGSGSSRGTGIAFSSRFGCRESLHSTAQHSTPLLRWRLLLEKESAAFGTGAGGAIELGRFGSIRQSGRRRPPWRARYGGGLEREREKKGSTWIRIRSGCHVKAIGAAPARRRRMIH